MILDESAMRGREKKKNILCWGGGGGLFVVGRGGGGKKGERTVLFACSYNVRQRN